jgi:glutaredoxin 3
MFCKNVKEFLSHRDVEFIERDVSQDKDAMKALEELGIMTTPVTVIDGEIVIGFDRPKLEQLLGDYT